jgi:hypothetical protein
MHSFLRCREANTTEDRNTESALLNLSAFAEMIVGRSQSLLDEIYEKLERTLFAFFAEANSIGIRHYTAELEFENSW